MTLEELHEAFGPQVATCVENVSRLSMVNQMLRRHLRQQVHAVAAHRVLHAHICPSWSPCAECAQRRHDCHAATLLDPSLLTHLLASCLEIRVSPFLRRLLPAPPLLHVTLA